MGVTTAPVTMHLMILVSLAAAATASPQIVPYEHVEIAAEPYVHQEIEALPYVHEEPELSDLALGIINRNKPEAVPVAAPVVPQQFAAPVAGVWTGTCLNNLGQGVACRSNVQAEAPVAVAQQQIVPQAQFVPQQQFVAQQPFSGVCVNNLGQGVACQAEAPVAVARQQFVPQAQFVPQQQFVAQQPFSGVCVNNLGAAVACSQ